MSSSSSSRCALNSYLKLTSIAVFFRWINCLARGVLDRRPDQPPPRREPGLHLGVALCLQRRVAEQDGEQRAEDLAPVLQRPVDGIGVLELPVLRVGSIGVEVDLQAPRRQVALGADVVAGEHVDGGGAPSPPSR